MNVVCRTGGCEKEGVVRSVPDQFVAPGLVTRPSNVLCSFCGRAVEPVPDDPREAVAAPERAAVARGGKRRTG